MKTPTISAVVTTYNAEEYVGQALTAILSQTRPPEEVVVVDDGSTDGTQEELARFGADIRVVRQANRGHASALNHGFGEARGDYLAKCDADDIWEPTKLERQLQALDDHPEIDIAFGCARYFGQGDGLFASPPGEGLLDRRDFARRLYRANLVCSTSTLIRRRLYQELGPFEELQRVSVEDYDYWLRALRAGAVFFYDPSVLVRCRRHESNVSNNLLSMYWSTHLAHVRYADLVEDSSLAHRAMAYDLLLIARQLVEENRPLQARAAFIASLGYKLNPRGLTWALILSAPERYRRMLTGGLTSARRALPRTAIL
jgi:glycosyltransferase involved in cell wall biosynthesis